MIDPTFWVGLATGLAASAVGGLALWWVVRKRLRGSDLPLPEIDPPSVPGTEGPLSPSALPLGDRSTVAAVRPEIAAPPESPRPDVVVRLLWEDGLRTSERLLIHVARQGVLGPEEVAPRPLCQAGMIEALGVSQGALTGVLRRLVAGQVLRESREHVRGIDRRVKVYRLTPAGERLVRQIRSRRPTLAPSGPPVRSFPARDESLPRVQIVPPP
ncbi:MAG: hypothetical protein L3K18_03365 [Thermoplasmata archaeon]|nr:hypothetical protein [Thermoplasmata archaeon]